MEFKTLKFLLTIKKSGKQINVFLFKINKNMNA